MSGRCVHRFNPELQRRRCVNRGEKDAGRRTRRSRHERTLTTSDPARAPHGAGRHGSPLDLKSKHRPFRIREGREFAGRDQVAGEACRASHDSRRDSQRDRSATPLGGLDRFAAEVQVCISAAGFEFATVNHAKDGPLADSEKLGGGVCGNPANLIG